MNLARTLPRKLARLLYCALILTLCQAIHGEPTSAEEHTSDRLRGAIEKSLALLTKASAGSADQRKCFTCHSQAIPVLAFAEAKQRGFEFDPENLARQLDHTHAHLRGGRKSYVEGKGQGGGVDTAGYALWTLESGERQADEVTRPVVDWLLEKQHKEGYWQGSSNRPPSEASNFTATYLALRALHVFASQQQRADVDRAANAAEKWLIETDPKDTEDRVFRLLSLRYISTDPGLSTSAAERLTDQQCQDGGWSQTDEMESDAYATGTVLYALSEAGVSADDDSWQAGIRFLLDHQQEDGSWHVISRSKPFQKYFESGFPHGKDQFISTSASGWATIALLKTLATSEASD